MSEELDIEAVEAAVREYRNSYVLAPVTDPDLAPNPPHVHGPVWSKKLDGSWWLPEKSLGWGILNWWGEYVLTPGGDYAGEPFMPTLEQARFILWWYAVDDRGNYAYREGVLRRMKGWGKDPLSAAVALAELCGPVAFSHFDSDGNPVGKQRHAAWIQIAAVSQEQTKNTFRMFPVMASKRLKTEYGLEINKFVIYYPDKGGQIEAVTSSPASMEGNRPTLTIRNETQEWIETNDGHEMANVINGNVTKIAGARCLSICNAHVPGRDSVAERDWDAYQDVLSGKAISTQKLYDAIEAPADTPLSEIPSAKEDPEGFEAGVQKLREGLLIARGDSVWLPVDEILPSILDRGNNVIESRRKFLNQVNAHEDSWIAPVEWNRCGSEGYLEKQGKPLRPLERGDRVTLGFDGSKSNDFTALVACRVEDAVLFVLGVWDPSKYANEEVPKLDVDAKVRSAFEAYDVVAMRADVKEFESYIDQWGQDFRKKIQIPASPGKPIAFDMRGQKKPFALDCERFRDAVLEVEVFHDDNHKYGPLLRQHVTNARIHPTIYDADSIRKASKDSSKKIDAAVCAVLAFGSRQEFLMSKRNRTRKAVVIQ